MANAVHLDGLRCDGKAFGGCQALCLLFWKEAWLKPVSETPKASAQFSPISNCTEADVVESTKTQAADGEPRYVCQATQLPNATSALKRWDISQYWEDYASGNVGLKRLACGFLYASFYALIQSGLGLGSPLRRLYDWVQAVIGGIPFPKKRGTIPKEVATPAGTLNLQPGEFVRVKTYEQILATLNTDNKNKGLYFDAEMVPFCGGTYRVLQKVQRIIDEKTGKLIKMKSESIILEGAFCQARYSRCRLFCPRSIYPYWREIWLERVSPPAELGLAETRSSVDSSAKVMSLH